jgi:hypothetical protein
VSTHEHSAGLVQHLLCPYQHLGQQVFDFCFYPIGHRGNGQGSLRLRPHGKDIAQAMVGGNLPEHIRVIHDRPEEIHRMDHDLVLGYGHHGGIVGMRQANEHVGTLSGMQACQGALEHRSAHFGATATTAHGQRRQLLAHVLACQSMRQRELFRWLHGG